MEELKVHKWMPKTAVGQREVFLAWEVTSGQGQGALGVTDSGVRALDHLTAAVRSMPDGCLLRGMIRRARMAPSIGNAPPGYVYGPDLIRVHRDPRSGAVMYEGELPLQLPLMPPMPGGDW